MLKKVGTVFKWLFLIMALLLGSAYLLIAINKQRILKSLNQELQSSINGEIHIGDIRLDILHEFPKIDLQVNDVYLRGPRYNIYQKDFLRLEKLFVSLDIIEIIQGKINLENISLENAEVFIFKTKDGYSNLDVFKKNTVTTDTASGAGRSILLDLKNIQISNTHIVFNDSAQGKSIGLSLMNTRQQISTVDSNFLVDIKGQIDFIGLMFKKEKGTFVKNKSAEVDLHLKFLPSYKTLLIDSSSIDIAKGRIFTKGKFIFNKPLWYALEFNTESVDAREAIDLLAESIQKKLQRFGANGMVKAKVNLEGYSVPGEPPKADVAFEAKNIQANVFGKQALSNVSVKGVFTNHLKEGEINNRNNSEVRIQYLEAMLNGLPIKATARVSNFADPDLDIHFTFNGKLSALNEHLDSSKFYLSSGRIKGDILYKGKLREYENQQNKKLTGQLKGQVQISNGAFFIVRKNLMIHGIQGALRFSRESLNLDKLNLMIGEDVVKVKGSMQNFIPFFTEPHPGTQVKVNIETDHLDLSHFIQSRKKQISNREKIKKRKKIYELLVKLEEMMDMDINIRAKELVKGNFRATQAQIVLKLKNNILSIAKVNMRFAGGNVKVNGEIREFSKELSPLSLNANFENVDMRSFMHAFDNFGSVNLTEKNISGTLNTSIQLSGLMNTEASILNNSLRGKYLLSIEQGKLIRFEPIMGVADLVFMNRNFDTVEFAKIEGNIETVGFISNIHRMEISSNVLRIFVEGEHTYDKQSNLLVQVPLNNLKRRPKHLKPENVGTDAKAGASVYVRLIAEKDKKVRVVLVPFPKKH